MPDEYQPLGRIDPSSLIGQAPPVVNQSSVAQLVDSFHKGFITADDIHERLAGATAAKRKVEIQAASEAMTPEAIAARQAQVGAAGAQAQLSQAQAGASLPLVQPTAELAQSTLEEQLATQKYGPGVQYFKALNPEAGRDAPMTPDGKPDYAERAKVGLELFRLKEKQKEALEKLTPKTQHLASTGDLINFNIMGEPITKDLETRYKPDLKPFAQPGTVTPATPAAPFAAPKTPAPMITGAAATAATAAPLSATSITPITPAAPTAKPEIGARTEAGYFMGEKAGQQKAFTEAQGKALNAMARAVSTQPTFDALEKKGFNPGDIGAALRMKAVKSGTLGQLATTAIPGPTRITPDERSYAAAANTWIQGILRVESGAAISKKEQGWYEDTFFPIMGDPPEIQKQKDIARKAATRSLEEVINGNHTPEEYDKFHKDIQNIAATIGAPTSPPTVAQGAAGTGPAAAAALPAPTAIPTFNSEDEGKAAVQSGQRFRVKGIDGTWRKP